MTNNVALPDRLLSGAPVFCQGGSSHFVVMAGLVPAIHVFASVRPQDVDARHKSLPRT